MTAPASLDLRDWIRDIPDFPKPGILFKDITPLLGDPTAFGVAIDRLAERYADAQIDTIAAAEARGFIFGAPLALKLNAGFVPIRKPGKLPYATVALEYQLEYGTDRLEVHTDALTPGRRSFFSTTCSRPAARCAPAASWLVAPAPRSSVAPSCSS
ncbi:MAG: adenine phosphoribosyltransferase [Isosphaeraceae bacterium]